ncbi:DUF4349 domain-containing protein [Alkalibacter rhizosphaerae]|uniref:Anti-sigma-W factor RsiW n=1 Tax=Alkalibacter rhizosphaerae TaxID=2815577 RepID=A0A974XEF4_9FIRM|nr:DUF4349 domain-containing protein [Alkalibacter rhizosphaerae]QSX08308.1 DUF4349 domain-containing protein [Alkalibacter rhizosphaerae]
MDHEKYLEWISRDLDGDLDPKEKQELDDHLKTCEECRLYRDDLQKMTGTLSQTPRLTLGSSVKERTVKAMGPDKKKYFSNRRWLPYAAALLVVFVLIVPLMSRFLGGGFMGSNDSAADNGGYPQFGGDDSEQGMDGGDMAPGEGREDMDKEGAESLGDFDPTKIIYNGSISLHTEDLKKTMEDIIAYTNGLGGFIQQSSSDFSQRTEQDGSQSGYLVLRIQSSDFNDTMKALEDFGDVISSNVNTTNITQQYQDVKGELDSYLIQQDRLLAYLEEAETIEDMLTIEEQLARVRSEINYRSTMIKNWDTQVAYSTIQVHLYQRSVAVSKVTSPFSDFGARIRDTFVKSINYLLASVSNLIVILTGLLPFIVVLAAAGFLGKFLWKKRKNKSQ